VQAVVLEPAALEIQVDIPRLKDMQAVPVVVEIIQVEAAAQVEWEQLPALHPE
jgi:hypothetical protein